MYLAGKLNNITPQNAVDPLLIRGMGHSGSTPDLWHGTQWIHSWFMEGTQWIHSWFEVWETNVRCIGLIHSFPTGNLYHSDSINTPRLYILLYTIYILMLDLYLSAGLQFFINKTPKTYSHSFLLISKKHSISSIISLSIISIISTQSAV